MIFPTSSFRVRGWVQRRLVLTAVLFLLAGAATAQAPGGRVTPNFRDADFVELVKAVSVATGKSFIIDPRIHPRVTLVASSEMSSQGFYEAFLAILAVHGLVAKEYGNLVTISVATQVPGLIWVNLPD